MYLGLKHNRRKILVLWYPNKKNLGDYYLYHTVCMNANNWGFDVIGMDVGAPYKNMAKLAKKCDFLWFAGGGIIERWIPDIIQHFVEFYEESHYIPYGITGISIGDFDYSDKFEQLAYWVINSSFFYTRDKFSADILNTVSNSKKVCDSSDVVFAYKSFLQHGNESKQKKFGINFREMPYLDVTGSLNLKDWMENIRKNVNEPIMAIPDEDNLLKKNDVGFWGHYTPQKAVGVISKIDYGIAMRYHVILIAAIMGKIFFPIDYCPKVTRLTQQLGIEDLTLHYNEADRLESVIEKYNCNEVRYKEVLRNNTNILHDKAIAMFTDVERIMKEKLL